MRDRTKVYEIVFWLSMLSILVWVILKSIGYINTPVIVQLLPLISAIFAAGAFFQMVFEMRSRIKCVERCIKAVQETLYRMDKRLSLLESKST